MAILGIDEVGRGPLAGPLVVGAVILPENNPEWVNELKDSKKLTAKKREKLSEVILEEAVATGFGWVTVAEIDEIGISGSLVLATRRAVKSVQRLHAAFSQIVIDGKVNFLRGSALEKYVSTMPKADDLVREVSAASIIAKVARDKYMCELAERYPEYGFDSHVGYGTAKHLRAIFERGVLDEHRKSFEPIKSLVGFGREEPKLKNTTKIGQQAEAAVVEYLRTLGHEIIIRNFRTYQAEIDIVSVCDAKIYFTEVKARSSEYRGGGLEYVTAQKQGRMKFAVEVFLKFRPEYKKYDPLLAAAAVNGKFEITDFVTLD